MEKDGGFRFKFRKLSGERERVSLFSLAYFVHSQKLSVPNLTVEIQEYYRKYPNLTQEEQQRSYFQKRLAVLLDGKQPVTAESCGLQRKFESRVTSIFSVQLESLALRREEVLDNLGQLFSDHHQEGGVGREELLPLTDFQLDSIASYLSTWSPRSRSSKLELRHCDDRLDHLSCVAILPPPDFPS